jgi:exoribonuclease R
MTQLKILIENRNYEQYQIVNATTFENIELTNFNPIEYKLLNNDIFTFNKEKVNIIHSSIRNSESIAAVLILNTNQTYGRYNNKLLYKCIPDDIRIPSFLVPYEIKKLGFSKLMNNLYVTIQFFEWINKHPVGKLVQTIGPVDVLENFYEYQLYCKSLNTSIQKFNKDTQKFLSKKSQHHENIINEIVKEYPQLENRTNVEDWNIFSIDPENSVDFDDAFSIKTLNNNNILLSIYISNVSIWIDFLNLWESFSMRISTIYLPDKKRPMLPTILSDCLCSLQQNKKRIAFVLDITLDPNDYSLISLNYSNCIINVKNNYIYEQKELLIDEHYLKILKATLALSYKYKYISKIDDSHDVVSYLMIFMNYHCGQNLMQFNNGIFRSTTNNNNNTNNTNSNNIPETLPQDVSKFITIWNSFSGQYIDYSKNISTRHEVLQMDAYIHITSPIRRLVDLLNMIQFQNNYKLLTFSNKAMQFYNKWLNELDYINTTMRSIKKVQNDCNLLSLCSNNPLILLNEYDGYCFDKIIRNDGLFQFIVFIPELKISSRIIIREDIENYKKCKFKLFLFHNEEKFKKKIRLQFIL